MMRFNFFDTNVVQPMHTEEILMKLQCEVDEHRILYLLGCFQIIINMKNIFYYIILLLLHYYFFYYGVMDDMV